MTSSGEDQEELTQQELLERAIEEQRRKEALEHRDVLLAIRAIIKTEHGQFFFKYLFKHFESASVPAFGLQGEALMDTLGRMRAGNAIFKLASEADSEIAGRLLASNLKEEYALLYQDSQRRS